MATKDKTEPTLSDALKNASASLPGLLPDPAAYLPDPAAYLADAAKRLGVITAQLVLPTGIVQTTFTFDRHQPSEYNEVVFTKEPFQTSEVAYELPADVVGEIPAEVDAANMEAALEAPTPASQVEGTAEPVALPELTHYSNPLRDHLKAQSAYYGAEIDRLARLTENAMKAQSAVHNALSSLDRDGL